MSFATPASARLRRARASWCGLWSSIVTRSGATLRTIASVAKPVPAPTSTTSSPGSSQAGERQRRVAHRRGPEQRVDPAVVAERDDPVEPARLGLVLDEAHRLADQVGERRRAGTRRRTAARRAGRSRRRRPGRSGSTRSAQRHSAATPSEVAGDEHGRAGAVEQQRRPRPPCPSPPSVSAPTPTASTGRGPSRTEKVAMPKRRSPSMSGTSLSTAIANEKGTVTSDQRPHARARPACRRRAARRRG